jgi:hypothetical protein
MIEILSPKQGFNAEEYGDLIHRLKEQGYEFLTARQWALKENVTDRFVVIVHDVDFKISGAYLFASVERSCNVRSSFFLRVDQEYFYSSVPFFQNLERDGFEIGLHHDSLSKAANNSARALSYFQSQLSTLRLFFNVSSCRGHGDYTDLSIDNSKLLSAELERSCTVREIRNGLDSNCTYIRDTNNRLQIPSLAEWKTSILVNFHSDWWPQA